ncbi:MAG: hypothetical protein RIR68_1229 [Pseudomonadota bacterium]
MRRINSMVLIVVSSLLSASMALAQSAGHASAAGKSDAKSKPAAQNKASKPAKKNEPVKRAVAAPPETPLAPQELSIAERVHVGHLPCELGASVQMTADTNTPGYFNLQGKGYKYRMKPVTTSTGAIRLEDEKAGAVWLQLANKSMLMDQKNGRRLADECAHPDQVAVANDMKLNPPPALIDVSNAATSVQR